MQAKEECGWRRRRMMASSNPARPCAQPKHITQTHTRALLRKIGDRDRVNSISISNHNNRKRFFRCCFVFAFIKLPVLLVMFCFCFPSMHRVFASFCPVGCQLHCYYRSSGSFRIESNWIELSLNRHQWVSVCAVCSVHAQCASLLFFLSYFMGIVVAVFVVIICGEKLKQRLLKVFLSRLLSLSLHLFLSRWICIKTTLHVCMPQSDRAITILLSDRFFVFIYLSAVTFFTNAREHMHACHSDSIIPMFKPWSFRFIRCVLSFLTIYSAGIALLSFSRAKLTSYYFQK